MTDPWELLEELEEDPEGSGAMELVEVLDAFEITERDEVESEAYVARYHEDRPDLVVNFPREMQLPPSLIAGVCSFVRRIARETEAP